MQKRTRSVSQCAPTTRRLCVGGLLQSPNHAEEPLPTEHARQAARTFWQAGRCSSARPAGALTAGSKRGAPLVCHFGRFGTWLDAARTLEPTPQPAPTCASVQRTSAAARAPWESVHTRRELLAGVFASPRRSAHCRAEPERAAPSRRRTQARTAIFKSRADHQEHDAERGRVIHSFGHVIAPGNRTLIRLQSVWPRRKLLRAAPPSAVGHA